MSILDRDFYRLSTDRVGGDVGRVSAKLSAEVWPIVSVMINTRPRFDGATADSVGQYSTEISVEYQPMVSAEMPVECRPRYRPNLGR